MTKCKEKVTLFEPNKKYSPHSIPFQCINIFVSITHQESEVNNKMTCINTNPLQPTGFRLVVDRQNYPALEILVNGSNIALMPLRIQDGSKVLAVKSWVKLGLATTANTRKKVLDLSLKKLTKITRS